MADVVAVVVAHDDADDLPACLAALLAQDHRPLRVVVVDNGSSDGSAEVARRAVAGAPRGVDATVVALPGNTGFTGGVNTAIARTDADLVALVNPDAVLAPDHLRVLAGAVDADPGLAAVQGTLVRPTGEVDATGVELTAARTARHRDEGLRPTPPDGPVVPVWGVTGAACLLRRAALDDVARVDPGTGTAAGWLTPGLFAYHDDVDLAWRLRLRGWRSAHVPAARASHRRAGAARRRSDLVEALSFGNRLRVVATLDDRASLLASAPVVGLTTLAQVVRLAGRPGVLLAAARRLVAARRDVARERAATLARASRSPAAVSAALPSADLRGWVGAWAARRR